MIDQLQNHLFRNRSIAQNSIPVFFIHLIPGKNAATTFAELQRKVRITFCIKPKSCNRTLTAASNCAPSARVRAGAQSGPMLLRSFVLLLKISQEIPPVLKPVLRASGAHFEPSLQSL
jgi:hypothetical protein